MFVCSNSGISLTARCCEPTRGTQYRSWKFKTELNERFIATLAAYQITKTNIATTDPSTFSLKIMNRRSRDLRYFWKKIYQGGTLLLLIATQRWNFIESTDFSVGNKIPNVHAIKLAMHNLRAGKNGGFWRLGFGLPVLCRRDRRFGK